MVEHDGYPGNLDTEWTSLLAREAALRETMHLSKTRTHRIEALREWWHVVEQVFYTLRKSINSPPTTLPIELFIILERTASSLAAGTIPKYVSDAGRAGRHTIHSLELEHVRWATTYRWAVRKGLLVDKRPVVTISQSYGVGYRTVQKWIHDHPPFPADLIKLEVDHPELIRSQMLRCGSNYAASNEG